MNTSYRDAYRSYLKNDMAPEKNHVGIRQGENSQRDSFHTPYAMLMKHHDSISDEPSGGTQYIPIKSYGNTFKSSGATSCARVSLPDQCPNDELSNLTLDENRDFPSRKKTDDILSTKPTVNFSRPSALQNRISPESSAEMMKPLTTSNSSNNSSDPRWAGTTRSSYYLTSNYSKTSGSSDRRQGGLVGLNNLGNTCFMNSILQCLSNTRPLLEYCLRAQFQREKNPSSKMLGSLFASYASLMEDLWNPELANSSTSPQQFKTQIQRFAPRFVGFSQQDSQEFLRYLLEGLHIEVNRVTKRPTPVTPDYAAEDKLPDGEKAVIYWKRYLSMDNSEIVDLFVGQLMSTLECSECRFKSTTFDPFWDLSLPVPKDPNVTILDCLRLFTAKDDLDGNERPVCGRCKTRQRCSKSFSIQKFPRILVLHLKRFSGERFRSKMSVLVDFPITDLNMSEFASPSCQQQRLRYNLYAVSNHSGSVYAGHYTATCKHPYRNEWYEYNDSRVRPASTRSIVSTEAYVLFYELADQP